MLTKLGGGEAIKITKGTVVDGYLTGCRIHPSKKKGEKPSVLFLIQDKKSGASLEVWANGAMKYAVMNAKGNGVKPELLGTRLRFTGGNKKKIQGRKEPMQDTIIEHDATDTLRPAASRKAKDYQLKP